MNKIGGFEAVPLTIHDTKPFIKADIIVNGKKNKIKAWQQKK